MTGYRFGRPEAPLPYTSAGQIPPTEIVLALLTRVKLVVKVPDALRGAGPGGDVNRERFEEALRHVVANTLVGLEADGFQVVLATVEQFTDAGG